MGIPEYDVYSFLPSKMEIKGTCLQTTNSSRYIQAIRTSDLLLYFTLSSVMYLNLNSSLYLYPHTKLKSMVDKIRTNIPVFKGLFRSDHLKEYNISSTVHIAAYSKQKFIRFTL